MSAARALLTANPEMRGAELSAALKAQGIDLDSRVASTYRYQILKGLKKARKGNRRMAGGAGGGGSSDTVQSGLDDLLRAAEKLGWQRVKDVVDKVIQAPA
jgi:hypothetical protein